MTDHRVDGWARRLARPDADLIVSTEARAPSGGESLVDGMARALAAPVTRRRAVALIGGAVVAGSLLRPGRAQADCFPGGPKVCSNPKGARVCVPDNLQCCSNDNCAIACPYPWRDCGGPAICNDTARMCTDPANRKLAGVDDNQTKFCSTVLTVTNGCVEAKQSQAVRGWCCRQNEDCRLVRDSIGTCACPPGPRGPRDCGDECCPKDQICVTTRNGTNCKPPCVPGRHYDENSQCVCDSGATCRNGCCEEGKECVNGRCAAPTETSDSFKDLFRSFGQFTGSDTGSQTAGSRGGRHRPIVTAAAGVGGTPVGSALLLLGAVNAQGAAAAIAITDQQADRAYRRRVAAATPRLPKLAGTPGFDPAAAGALDALLAAQARAYAQILATATALARARGALRAGATAQARRQALAAAGLAAAAAKALRRIPPLRAAPAAKLRAGGVAEVTVAAVDVTELQDSVAATGLPADLAALLKGLGVAGGDLRRARQAFAVEPVGGPALIAPLSDPARLRNLTKLAGELDAYARGLRRTPIRRSRPRPLRVRPPRARTG